MNGQPQYPMQEMAQQLQAQGRMGDSILMHVNPAEARGLAALSPTGQLTINPVTGQPEAFWSALLPMLGSWLGSAGFGTSLASLLGVSAGTGAAIAGGLGSGLVTAALTKDLKRGLVSGVVGAGLGSAMNAASTNAANAAASSGSNALGNSMPSMAGTLGTAGTPSSMALWGSTASPEVMSAALAQQAAGNAGSAFANSLATAGTPSAMAQWATPDTLSFGERLMQPFQEGSGLFGEIMKPRTMLPMAVGMGQLAEWDAQDDYEDSIAERMAKDKERRRKVREGLNTAYAAAQPPGYAEGGRTNPPPNTPEGEGAAAVQVQQNLRGRYKVKPPTAWQPGFNAEFDYFQNDPNNIQMHPWEPGPWPWQQVYYQPYASPINRFAVPTESWYPYQPEGQTPYFNSMLRSGGKGGGAPAAATPPPPPPPSPPPPTGGTTPPNPNPPGYSTYDYTKQTYNKPGEMPGVHMSFKEWQEKYQGTGKDPIDPIKPGPDPRNNTDPLKEGRNFGFSNAGWKNYPTGGGDNFSINKHLDKTFKKPKDQGSDPNWWQRGLIEHGGKIGMGLGLATGVPGMGQIGKWGRDLYFNNNAFQSPADVPPSEIDAGIEQMLRDNPGSAQSLRELAGGNQSPAGRWEFYGTMGPWYGFQQGGGGQITWVHSRALNQKAEGGQVGPLPATEGGIASLTPPTAQPAEQPSEQDVRMVAAALSGEAGEQGPTIIEMFIQKYGVDVFRKVRQMVLQSIQPNAQTEGMIRGQGGGMDDQVMGMIGSQQPVAVSPGEYIVPADVVSGLGDGSSDAGAAELDQMLTNVRRARGGSIEQPPPLEARHLMPQ